MDRSRVIDQLSAFFARTHDGVAAAWLFGSVARDQASAASDVDVAILLTDPAGARTLDVTLDWWKRIGDDIAEHEIDASPGSAMSAVRSPASSTASIAASTACASVSALAACRSSSATEPMVPIGLATFRPASVGADPWIGS